MELWETHPKGDSARHPLGEEQATGTEGGGAADRRGRQSLPPPGTYPFLTPASVGRRKVALSPKSCLCESDLR